jgi:DtxR family Mn-dependent transcriptional regulator
MYLRTIFELEEEGLTPLRARIAERIGHSGPTVSQTVARMERDGLLVVEEDRHLALTPLGRARATRVMRKHRLAERLLTDVIGLDWSHVHDEACRWEHVMSEDVERRLVEILDHPSVSPYGNPIPGLEELEDGGELAASQLAAGFMDGVVRLTEVVESQELSYHVVRLGENLQTKIPLLADLHAAGVRPGAVIRAHSEGERVSVKASEDGLLLEPDTARHVFVDP